MKFWEAMKCLEEGKKVTNDKGETYFYTQDNKIYLCTGELAGEVSINLSKSTYEYEWEIYEEKKDVDEDFKKLYSYLKNEDGFVNNQYSEFIYNEGEENHLLAFYRQLLRMSKYYNLD